LLDEGDIMNRKEKAVKLFESGFSCSQAVLCAYADLFGLDEKYALKVAGGFGAGIGGTANLCGAVSGAIMVLGLKYSSTDSEDKEKKAKNYQIAKSLMEEFEKEKGTLLCKELLGYDISIPEIKEKVKNTDIFKQVCPNCVAKVTEILEKML
jgi:C_GCAxxG_C_C family probable redox protein